ncbi:MAG: GDSL-type esterase/lipase family protein [Ruminococcus flavefaciens]|nr:GDSL-type esterase/lipase family protein [Ruminococcus flavefaciens]MCM1229094.1 GDSL-type esterase/lipase family protein [Ruminococcus flavefaciens]
MRAKRFLGGLTSLAMSLSVFAGVSVQNMPVSKAVTTDWKFDFGGNGAESGYTGVSAKDGYSASKGYGFAQTANVADVKSSGTGAYSDAVQFKSEDTANTFNVDLPNGLYEVTVITGDCSRTSIKMEGILQMMNLTGNNAVETVQIPVTDGQLNIQAVAGRANTPFSISAVEIKQLNSTGETNPTIWLCGDSTVANYYNVDDSAQHGWGQFLGNYVDDKWEIRNMAASGQYAKGFVDAGQFAPIETYGKQGDIYVISIGINDTNYSNKDEYYETVTDMVEKAKAKGMDVVLVKQQGRRADLNRSPLLSGRWFGGQLDQIGTEQDVTVIDLFNPWQDFGISVGYDGMGEYYAIQADGSADDLHQSKKGSLKLAELVSQLYDFDNAGTLTAEVFDESVMYTFRNVNSGLYMEVADGKIESGANVQQWGMTEPAPYNVWRLKSAGDGYYYILPALSDDVYLDVAGNKALNGQNIGLYVFKGTDNQQFRFTKNADGTYKIRTKVSGDKSAVEVTDALKEAGANIQQWEVNGANCQDWIIEKGSIAETTTATESVPTTTTTTTTTTTAPDTGILLGDANCDGVVDIADAAAIIQSLGNKDKYALSALGKINADVYNTGDGVTGMDALLIQRVKAGLDELPVYVPPTAAETTTADPHYYAVDQSWSSGVAETVNEGFTKTSPTEKSEVTGYLNLDNMLDSSVTFDVEVPVNGNYMTHIRFANGTDSDRKMKVYVNGNTTDYWVQSFTGTGAWSTWAEFGIVLPLVAGRNTIQLVSATENGGPNLDYITLTLTDEPFAETYVPEENNKPVENNNPTIYIAGDSTVQSYRASYAPQQGWGYYLADYFDENVTVANHSIAGRSTKKFYDEGRWQTIADSLKEGDYVMVQFAINDSGKANEDRYAPVCGNIDNPSDGSYEWYMTEFIKSAQEKGATPILVTTVIGMKAYSGGQFVNSYSEYCNACKQLSAKYNIPCIDLNTLMVNHYNSIGYDKALTYHLMGVVEGSTDGTHFCEEGANAVAGLVAGDVKSQKIAGLAEHVK